MANASKRRSKKINIARNMPPLFHKVPGQNYSTEKSEVIQWLIQNPSVQEFVWDNIKQSGDVVFDPQTGKWQGVDYEG